VSVVAPPPKDELELLIREARARQRRRRLVAAVTVAVAALGLSIYGSLAGSGAKAPLVRGRPGAGAPSFRCRADQLRLSWRPNGASAGQGYTDFTFTNESARSCALHGWPTLGFVLRGGRRLAVGAGHAHNGTQKGRLSIRTVVLRPHAAASFNVRTTDHYVLGHPSKCSRIRVVLVTPPGARLALRVRQRGLYCGRKLEAVTPLVPGRLDRYWVVG
jgi:hypothetical protein